MTREGEFPEVVAEARPKYGTTELLTIPNVFFANVTTALMVTNALYYFPFTIRTPVTITAMTIEVTTARTGKAVRLGIYRADKDWQPTSLVKDAGTLSVGSIAVVPLTGLSISLQEGRYLIALHSEANPVLRAGRGAVPFFLAALGANTFNSIQSVSKTYAVLADPGTPWDTVEAYASGFYYPVFLTLTP